MWTGVPRVLVWTGVPRGADNKLLFHLWLALLLRLVPRLQQTPGAVEGVQIYRARLGVLWQGGRNSQCIAELVRTTVCTWRAGAI